MIVLVGIIKSGRRDSNSRPSAPKADALASCATPRTKKTYRISNRLAINAIEKK